MTKAIAKWLALALCAMLTLSGCGLVTIDKGTGQTQQAAPTATQADAQQAAQSDPQKDAQVVAEYTGGQVTYGEAMKEYQNWLSYYEAYGYTLTEESDIKDLKQQVLDTLVQQKIVEAKAKEMGLTELTEDEKKAVAEQAKSEYEDAVSYYMSYLEGDSEEETRKNAVDYLNSIGYTLESIQQYDTENAWQEKLKTEITKDVTVTDAQVQAAYDSSVSEDKASFTEDTYNFENAATYGDTITWVPEGYRAVKHILLSLPEEDSNSMADLQSQIEDINVRIEEIQNPEATEATEEGDTAEMDDALTADTSDGAAADTTAALDTTDAADATAAPEATIAADATQVSDGAASDEALTEGEEDFSEDSEFAEDGSIDAASDEVASEDDAALENLTLPELEAKKADLTTQLDALKAAALARLQPKIDEIQTKIAAGEDFDMLIEAYGEDDGMKTEPTKTNGYYVSESSQMWDDEFTTAAMALLKVGDVSAPVLSLSGVHIIKYIADVTPGAVPLEKVKAEIQAETLDTAKNDLYDQTVSGWVTAANAKTYVDKLA